MITMMAPSRLRGGLIDDMEDDDNRRGPEPDESEGRFLRVVIPSVGGGISPSRLAPRGSGMQCDTCGGWFGVTFWRCGACAALGAVQQLVQLKDERPALPRRPKPRERDRDESPAPARPHPQNASSGRPQ